MVKARKQAEKILQKKANKIKQKIESKEKTPAEKKEKKKSRGALQREKKRARKEAGGEEDNIETELETKKKKSKAFDDSNASIKEKTPKLARPQKKRKVDNDENKLEDMIRSYKEAFSGSSNKNSEPTATEANKPKTKSREAVSKCRWFE